MIAKNKIFIVYVGPDSWVGAHVEKIIDTVQGIMETVELDTEQNRYYVNDGEGLELSFDAKFWKITQKDF